MTTRYALLSVTDKKNIEKFAKNLVSIGFTILSTGGTAKVLRNNGIEVTDVSDITGHPECLSGRVKTLHPKVHGAILYDRENPDHKNQVSELGIGSIEVVAVNLYNFREQALEQNLSLDKAIEHIDIGGPTMLRAAAKNWRHVMAVIDPDDYDKAFTELKNKSSDLEVRKNLAQKVFKATSEYDDMIQSYFIGESTENKSDELKLDNPSELRYGENPHQKAVLYKNADFGFSAMEVLHGKELSYNNIIDLDAAVKLAADLNKGAISIIKHTNPCGVSIKTKDKTLKQTFLDAFHADNKSAFGGIVAINDLVDLDTASEISKIFIECVAAPDFSDEALQELSRKKNIRLVKVDFNKIASSQEKEYRSVSGGVLSQSKDSEVAEVGRWNVVSKREPSKEESQDLATAQIIVKHVKSNAVVFVKDGTTISVGAGQMSRIDSAEFANKKASEFDRNLRGSVMASDAFFPFPDCVEKAGQWGVTAIIQPGGSKNDGLSIEEADKHSIAMVTTGVRHFKH